MLTPIENAQNAVEAALQNTGEMMTVTLRERYFTHGHSHVEEIPTSLTVRDLLDKKLEMIPHAYKLDENGRVQLFDAITSALVIESNGKMLEVTQAEFRDAPIKMFEKAFEANLKEALSEDFSNMQANAITQQILREYRSAKGFNPEYLSAEVKELAREKVVPMGKRNSEIFEPLAPGLQIAFNRA